MEILNSFPLFLLVLVRIASFVVTMPVFSYRTIPGPIKVGFAVTLSILIEITLFKSQTVPLDGTFVLLALKEALVGLSMGFVAGMLTYSVQLAGSFIDLQMGFAIASTISPENGITTPLTGQLLYMLQMLFFLGVDAHYMLLNGLLYSFRLIPVNEMGVQLTGGSTAELVARVSAQMFIIALQLAMPIVGCLFLVDIAVGLVARTVPQVNVFVVGLPMKVIAGFLVLLLVFPMFISLFRVIFDSMTEVFSDYLRLLGS
ncbi:flagellar type III secretion system protein FliR [Sporolactobacillus sp. THM7-4]|nr:flagellar type III secretion system protein FliR [Sporolactobacillus sp. THM7-4]